MKALLIINPNSRRADDPALERGLQLLREGGVKLVPVTPDSADALPALVEQYRDDVDLVVIAGGDGTLNAAADALQRHRLPLGILPLGTANDLARTLGIPEDPEQASELILRGHRRPVDMGQVNGHSFFNVAHIGLGTYITHQLSASAKKHWGVFSYLQTFFTALHHQRNFRVTLIVDGETRHMRTIHVAVGNGRYYGGGNLVEENARIDDGHLVLFSLKPLTVRQLLLVAPLLRLGKQRAVKEVYTAYGKEINVHTTQQPMEVHADGEHLSWTPAQFRVIPGAVQVFTPPWKYGETKDPA